MVLAASIGLPLVARLYLRKQAKALDALLKPNGQSDANAVGGQSSQYSSPPARQESAVFNEPIPTAKPDVGLGALHKADKRRNNSKNRRKTASIIQDLVNTNQHITDSSRIFYSIPAILSSEKASSIIDGKNLGKSSQLLQENIAMVSKTLVGGIRISEDLDKHLYLRTTTPLVPLEGTYDTSGFKVIIKKPNIQTMSAVYSLEDYMKFLSDLVEKEGVSKFP